MSVLLLPGPLLAPFGPVSPDQNSYDQPSWWQSNILAAVLTAKLHANLPVELKSQAQAILNSLPVAQSFPLGSPERNSIIAAYISAYRILVLICLVATAIAFLIALLVEDVRMPENENRELPTGAYKNEGEKADAS